MRHVVGLSVLVLLSSVAWGASPSKMTDEELVTALLSDKSQSNREKAADEIGKRQLESAIPSLLEACRPVEHEFVCDHALRALEQIRVPASREAMAAVLLDERLKEWKRKTAMRVLGRADESYLAAVAPRALTRYRSMDGDFGAPLVESLVKGGNTAVMDLTIVIATDVAAHRRTRVAALDAAEAFKHPRLFEAYVALLDDTDKAIRLRCAQELGRSGMPGNVVVAPLMKVAQFDEVGEVRVAAFKSLKHYASPQLLPLLHHAVINERNVIAWAHALQLFQALADASSLTVLDSLVRNPNIIDDEQIRLIGAAVRIGDPMMISALQVRIDDPEEVETVKAAARNAIALLGGSPADRLSFVQTLVVPDVVMWVPTVEVAPLPALSIQVDPMGVVQWGAIEATFVTPSVSIQVR